MPTKSFRYSHLNLWLYSKCMKVCWRFVGKVFPTYGFDFDLPLPSDQAEARVISVGLSARMSERVLFSRVPQQPSILRLTRVLSLLFNESLINGAALISAIPGTAPSGAMHLILFLTKLSFGSFFVAYMDVGKGREQDAEALL